MDPETAASILAMRDQGAPDWRTNVFAPGSDEYDVSLAAAGLQRAFDKLDGSDDAVSELRDRYEELNKALWNKGGFGKPKDAPCLLDVASEALYEGEDPRPDWIRERARDSLALAVLAELDELKSEWWHAQYSASRAADKQTSDYDLMTKVSDARWRLRFEDYAPGLPRCSWLRERLSAARSAANSLRTEAWIQEFALPMPELHPEQRLLSPSPLFEPHGWNPTLEARSVARARLLRELKTCVDAYLHLVEDAWATEANTTKDRPRESSSPNPRVTRWLVLRYVRGLTWSEIAKSSDIADYRQVLRECGKAAKFVGLPWPSRGPYKRALRHS